jgi:hypothetical protein
MTSESGMSENAPSLRYYRVVEGRWRAALLFTVRSAGWLPRFSTFNLVLDTSVDATSRVLQREVVHTTKISKWGFTFYEAIETLALDPNGKDVVISRRERFAPSSSFKLEHGRSRAEVDPNGTRARYWFPFFGAELVQTVTIEADVVRVVQQTSFWQSEALLKRMSTA